MEDSKVAVLLEHLESQLSAIAEGVVTVNEKLDAHIEENRRDFNMILRRLDENSAEHRQNKQEHQLMMHQLKCPLPLLTNTHSLARSQSHPTNIFSR